MAKGEVEKKYWNFYDKINNLFEGSYTYIVKSISETAVEITDGKLLSIILNEGDVMNIYLQPRLAFILTEGIEITYYRYKDVLVIM